MSQRYKPEIFNKNNKLLLEFYDKPVSSSRSINLVLDRSPDLWDSLQVEGEKSEILSIIDTRNNKIAVAMICSQKKCFFHGQIINVSYASGLKVSQEYQGTIVLSMLFKLLRMYSDETKPLIWFFSVFGDNEKGLKLFNKKNKIRPIFKRIGKANTYIFKKRYLPIDKTEQSIKVKNAAKSDSRSILQFIENEGKRRAFLPDYKEEDLINGKGLLSHFNLDNLLIAENNDGILGIMGLWDQIAMRRWKVINYTKSLKLLRPIINIGAKLVHLPFLPALNMAVDYKLLNLNIVKNNDRHVFKLLFNNLMNSDRKDKSTYSIALMDYDPLNKYFKKRSIRFSNIFFIAAWPENISGLSNLNVNDLYIEQGGL